jgi:hypothetical protein
MPCAFDTNNDSSHCGAGCAACATGTYCSQGQCVCGPAPYEDCSGSCVNTNSDTHNCGGCGNACATCSGGKCPCSHVFCGGHDCGCAGVCCGSGGSTCCAPP